MNYYLIFGITYAFAAAAQPGPFQTYIISQTLNNGWKSTLPATFAPIISDIPIFILIMFILRNVPNWFEHVLQTGGGLFLLFLAYSAYKSWKNFDPEQAVSARTTRQTLIKAATVNILNPNPYIGWSLIMGPLFLKAWREGPAYAVGLVGSFYLTMIIVTIGIIFLFAFARNLGPRVNRGMVGLSVVGLLLFGLYQLWLGLGPLILQNTSH